MGNAAFLWAIGALILLALLGYFWALATRRDKPDDDEQFSDFDPRDWP